MNQDGLEYRDVGDIGNLVFAEIRRDYLAVVVDQFFHQACADGHDGLAVDLSLVAERIDDRADVVGCDELVEFDSAGVRIDFDLGDLSDKRSR
jgi:hypothetical protein